MIRNYLDLSTGHVTKEDNDLLELGEAEWPYDKHQFGWWIYVPSTLDDTQKDLFNQSGLSPMVWALIHYARNRGCDRICLDRDADRIDELPFFEW